MSGPTSPRRPDPMGGPGGNAGTAEPAGDGTRRECFFPRASGILLHPTSLPAAHGIGDLGPEAYRFVDFLAHSRQSLWQVLPLNPTAAGNSPYAAPSAFAGNALLISLERLVDDGLLSPEEPAAAPELPSGHVDYDQVRAFKMPLLRLAFERFKASRRWALRAGFEAFCARQAAWLNDYALFQALKAAYDGAPWTAWDADLVARQPLALARCRAALADQVERQCFLQFVFFRQWSDLRSYAKNHNVRIMGDIPMFVAHDSVDVWANRALFQLDARGRPTVVSGVPPDYFSRTGQRWGNPLYRWDLLAETGYAWWINRFRATLGMVDVVRLDHFRGFQSYWEVPAGHGTAEHGRWVPGPGAALFEALEAALGPLPIVVEDLGLITPDVEDLRRRLGYPGMKVLQFAFGDDARNAYLPHNYQHHCVVYTATHDNTTTVGWFATTAGRGRANTRAYLGTSGRHVAWDLIRLALGSVADTAIVPLQDVLELSGDARMNFPGQAEGNWAWRYAPGQLKAEHAERLGELTAIYGRDPARTPSSDIATSDGDASQIRGD